MSKRLTIPEGSTAIILPNQLASELFALCKLLRKPKQSLKDRENFPSVQAIASDVLLALIDAGYEPPINGLQDLVGKTFIANIKKEQS